MPSSVSSAIDEIKDIADYSSTPEVDASRGRPRKAAATKAAAAPAAPAAPSSTTPRKAATPRKRAAARTVAPLRTSGTVKRPNGTDYHPRSLGEHSDVAALKAARESGIPVMLYGPPGTGKLLPLDTPIPTPTGWTAMGDLEPGDQVLGRDGLPTKVVYVSDVEDTPVLYDITFSDGSVITACADHQWTVVTRNDRVAAREANRDRGGKQDMVKTRRAALQRIACDGSLPVAMSASDLFSLVSPVENLPWAHPGTLRSFLVRDGVSSHRAEHVVRRVTRRTGAASDARSEMMLFDTAIALKAMSECERAPFRWSAADSESLPEAVMTTQQMVDFGVTSASGRDQRNNFSVRMPKALELPDRDLPVDPYVFGVWLGDGDTEFKFSADVTSADPQIVNEVVKAGYDLHGIGVDKRGNNAFTFTFSGLGRDLGKAGMSTKRIPMDYLRSSKAQRLALLQGLMDTDGSISRDGACELTLSDPDLAADAEELIHSLGIKVTRNIRPGGYRTPEGERRMTADRHRMAFTTPLMVFRLERKARYVPVSVRPTQNFLYVTDITPAPTRPGKCIQVDNADSMYLCGRTMVPTHNTALIEAAFGEDAITVTCTGDTEVGDLQGGYVQNADDPTKYDWVDGPATVAAEEGKVLFLDDATLASPKALAAVYPLMDGRGEMAVRANPSRGTVKAKEGFYVVAGHNPGVYGAVLTEALASRFLIHVEVHTDYDLARSLGVSAKAVKAAENLSRKQRSQEINWAPQLRELLGFAKVEAALGTTVAVSNLAGVCPPEDRDVVCSVLSDVFGERVSPLGLGGGV